MSGITGFWRCESQSPESATQLVLRMADRIAHCGPDDRGAWVGDAALLVGGAGVVVPKEDSVALAQGLARVLEMTPDASQQLGRQAKARIHAEFAMTRTRDQFEELYTQVIEKGGR